MKVSRKKVIAIASHGGHLVQLMRMAPALSEHEVTLISTVSSNPYPELFDNYRKVYDCNFNTKLKLIITSLQLMRIIVFTNPNVIISTGAAPGIIGIAIGKLLGKKLVWIDSVANAENLSLSGRLASKLTHHIYTQWQHVAVGSKARYIGRVI